mmetsp:Transcript_7862/g.25675  ORF Transcript_7862/g.25675 Transcript_7862/m.25675 type:complete len:80 (-) Transcript_7862:27-266(-)
MKRHNPKTTDRPPWRAAALLLAGFAAGWASAALSVGHAAAALGADEIGAPRQPRQPSVRINENMIYAGVAVTIAPQRIR